MKTPKHSMLLYGKNPVYERLKANPKSIRQIFVQENFDAAHILNLIKLRNIASKYVSERELYKIKRADRVQGIVAQIDEFKYTPFEDLLYRKDKQQSFIFLDSINDPHNLGSIIRIAACLGGFAIVVPKYQACQVNETVLHVACGGENFVPISMVNNLSGALIKAKKEDYWIAGTVVKGGQDISSVKFPYPLCLVLGSEGKGVRYGIEKQFELKLSLPMRGASLSFNVAMATAIFCYEITKQRLTST